MNINELKLMQNYPLDLKIMKTQQRIREWVSEYGVDGVYVAFSGGKDSTVLLHIVRSLYPNIEGVFANTGNEFPEIIKFVRRQKNIKWVKPEKSFVNIVREEGFPMISKKTAKMIKALQYPNSKNVKSRQLYLSNYALNKNRGLMKFVKGTTRVKDFEKYILSVKFAKSGKLKLTKNTSFKLAKKYRYLIDSEFDISNSCCDYLKKKPMKTYGEFSSKVPFIGEQASESDTREKSYLKTGCNNFESKDPKSKPLGFWREQDILNYIYTNKIEIAEIYGEVLKDDLGNFYTTGESRTGCVACGFGCGMWKNDNDNRFLNLEKTHPKFHNYIINVLGYKNILEYMNIRYTDKQEVQKEKVKLGNVEVEQLKWIV